MTSIFAEATRKVASARFKQPQLDAEGQAIEVLCRLTASTGHGRGGRVSPNFLPLTLLSPG